MEMPLDMYDDIPRAMRAYLRNYGYSFSRKACEFAVKRMKRKSGATDKLEPIEPYTKEQIEELLTKYGVKLEHSKGYDFVYLANMCKADLLKSSVPDEQHLALYIKNVIDDPDMPGGNVFRHYLVDLDAKGIGVDWEDWL